LKGRVLKKNRMPASNFVNWGILQRFICEGGGEKKGTEKGGAIRNVLVKEKEEGTTRNIQEKNSQAATTAGKKRKGEKKKNLEESPRKGVKRGHKEK